MASSPASTPNASDDAGTPVGASHRDAALDALHPFTSDICASWRDASADEAHSAPLHQRALDELKALADEGRVVLLNAPRAGHGKTHLLGRVAGLMADSAVVTTLPWQSPEALSWETTGRGIISDLSQSGGRPNSLQRVCAGVAASLLRKLIQLGRIPSTDPAQALQVLAKDPMQLYTDAGPARVIGDWFRRHFDQLRRPLAEASGVEGHEEVEAWVGAMHDYATQVNPTSLAAMQLLMSVHSQDQVLRFVKLVGIWKPLVLVADHMDGLYRDAGAGQVAARMALELANIPTVRLVLSLNQDLWDTSFGRNLPSAFEDRLTARSISLRGLDETGARKLVELRLHEAGVAAEPASAFLDFLDLGRYFMGRPLGSVSARGLLRHAASQWRAFVTSPPSPEKARPAPEHQETLLRDDLENGDPLPTFDAGDEAEIQRMVAVLQHDAQGEQVPISHAEVEPDPAPPTQSIIPEAAHVPPAATPLPTAAPLAAPPAPESPPLIQLLQPAQVEPESFLGSAAATPAHPQAPSATPLREAPQNSFQKLRHMLSKLKVATDSVPLPDSVQAQAAVAAVGTAVAAAAPHIHGAPAPAAAPHPASNGDADHGLLARFETLRSGFLAEPAPTHVDWQTLNELIRLAGKRFTVVHYDEVELPGLSGRSLPRWSLHGMEIVFGLDDFTDERYWKTVSSFVAGRTAEIAATAAAVNEAPPQLKLDVFKADADGGQLSTLIKDEVIPPAVRMLVDTVHLDNRTLASLKAMRALVREAESGQLSTNDPSAVLGALATELDFFWKRLIRPR